MHYHNFEVNGYKYRAWVQGGQVCVEAWGARGFVRTYSLAILRRAEEVIAQDA